MIGTRRRQDLASSSICSTCTSVSSNGRWSDLSTGSPFSPTLLSAQRPILKSARRFIIPLVPPAWSPISQISPQAALRDFCIPRQEPRPPVDILNRSSLNSCSPSLAKFSRTIVPEQNVSISTSTTTLPSAINTGAAFLHPTMDYLTVNGLKTRHHHHHHHHCRQTR